MVRARDPEAGYILYERPFGAGYEMRRRRADESEPYCLLTFDGNGNFPHDQLDDIILKGIPRDYPSSCVSDYRIAADSDLKSVELLQQQPRWEFTFAFHGSGPQELLIADVRRGIPHYSSTGRCRSV